MRDQDESTSNDSDPIPAMMHILRRLTEMNECLERLTLAAESRDVIGQAKGILMERYGISVDEAIGLLMTASNDSHTAIKDAAANLTLTGQLPHTTN